MNKYVILYNPLSGNRKGKAMAEQIVLPAGYEPEYVDITQVPGYESVFKMLSEGDKLVIVGGDGTLNRFVNDVGGLDYKNEIYIYAAGSGNDFLKDVGGD